MSENDAKETTNKSTELLVTNSGNNCFKMTDSEGKKEQLQEENEEFNTSDGDNSQIISKSNSPLNMSPGAMKLRCWLNKTFRVEMSDGRVLLGVFLCTDRDRNIILGSCSEYLPLKVDSEIQEPPEEPRVLGLVMVPGKHIVSIHLDELGVGIAPIIEDDVM